jgi:tRNA (adenine22-N1)-methyltransferase
MISNEESVLDIGCDHGYLALQLRLNGNFRPIICSDNKIGPLNNARKNLLGYDDISFVLTSGAEKITEPVHTVVMSGLGYQTVTDIITASRPYFDLCERLIIQINTLQDKLRRWLMENGYMIVDEKMIKDYRYYQIMDIRKGEQKLSELEIMYGPVLLSQHSQIFVDYLNDQIARKRLILEQIDPSSSDHQKIVDKINELESLL